MSLPKDKAWFPSKRFGYGWGFPTKWQGWITMLVYLLVIGIGIIWLANEYKVLFTVFTIVLTGILIAICFWKGETPR